jgi:hypothetical protein
MPLDFAQLHPNDLRRPAAMPNIVPDNNLRLPDALTVKYGPAPLLSRFVLRGDQAVRQMGVRLRVRHDFDELVYVNRQQVNRGNWFPLVNMFNPDQTNLAPENSFWLSGENEAGEIMLTWAARVFDWPDSTLEDNIGMLFCDKEDRPYPCRVAETAAPVLRSISGTVFWGGSLWIHPDYRHHNLSRVCGRLGRAFAVSRWPLDWIMCLVMPVIVEKGIADGYGYRHIARGIVYPGSPLGDLEFSLVYLSTAEAYADFSEFLADELSGSAYDGARAASSGTRLLQTVTSISSVAVDHGNSSRSYREL